MKMVDNLLTSKQVSNIFWISSAIAIYMVVCAHCTYDNYYLERITRIFGSIGVPVFLVRSGFYLNIEEPTKRFWFKKLKSIIIPWLIISPCLYVFSIFRNIASFSLVDCVLYCIGYETWLYYIFILIVYYVVFRLLKEEWFLYVSIVLFVISNILDVYGMNWLSNFSTPYLNFFNRIGYFAIGILLSKNDVFDKLVNNRKLSVICMIMVIPLGIPFVWWYTGLAPTLLLIIYRLLCVYFVLIIAKKIQNEKWLISVGKDTFLVYFLHMQFGLGVASKLLYMLHIGNECVFFIFKPFLAISSVLIGIIALRKIVILLGLEKYAWIIGLRIDNKNVAR